MEKYPKNSLKNKERGFIALISTLIIASALSLLMFSNSTSSFFARFDALGSEFKRTSLGLSESCLNYALLQLAQNYDYGKPGTPYELPPGGKVVTVGDGECVIQSIEEVNIPSPECNSSPNHKCLRIKTSARYPLNNGSWSANEIKIDIQKPTYSPTNPPPTCSFVANATSISQGQTVTFSWASSPNAVSFKIERDIGGTITTYDSGDGVGVNSPALGWPDPNPPSASATYTATVTGSGGSSQCEFPRSVTVQPSLACADTVMTLDRTGTIFSAGANGPEKAAAKVLLNLYKAVIPTPKVGVVRFGDNTNGGVEAEVVPDGSDSGSNPDGWLSTNFGDDDGASDGDLFGAVELALNTQSSVGTNMSDAFNVTRTELNSSRHDPTKSKVMIFVSDGDPNEPTGGSGDVAREATLDAADTAKKGPDNIAGNADDIEIFTIHFGADLAGFAGREIMASLASGDIPAPSHSGHGGGTHQPGSTYDGIKESETALRSPSAQATDSGDGWINASGAQSNGGINASDNQGDRERYYTFGFPLFPAGAIPTGIEVVADAWSDIVLLNDDFGTGSTDSTFGENPVWTEGGAGAEKRASGSGNDSPRQGVAVGDRFALLNSNDGYICRSVDSSGLINLTLSYYWRGDIHAEATDSGIVEYATGGTCASPTGLTPLKSHPLNTSTSLWSLQNISLPAVLNNNNSWFIRFRVNSNVAGVNSEDFRVDGVSIAGNNASSNSCQLGVSLSWDGGTTWTSGAMNPTKVQGLTSTENLYTLGGKNDDWGHVNWQVGDLDNASFRLRVHDIDTGASCQDNATTHLDWIQTKIYYTEPDVDSENYDNDHFFISTSPTGADMPGIFDTIGKLACPAAVAPLPPEPPDDPPDPPLPPQPIDIGSWDEVINVLP